MKKRSRTIMPVLFSAGATAIVAAGLMLVSGLPGAAVRSEPTALPAAQPAVQHRDKGAQNLGDPDYGVCRGTDPKCYHDWHNFDTSEGYRVLLYTRTAGPRHANLGPALAPGLNPPFDRQERGTKRHHQDGPGAWLQRRLHGRCHSVVVSGPTFPIQRGDLLQYLP
ncbi:hypothetical protein [Nakamurella lactea]|uniref:hypothetical protein n=1 Tax=Nakamurella lactea TaxID=459515 RepID=UPI001FDFF9A3|nr:hypothetical protein [Nakamurella lactea]